MLARWSASFNIDPRELKYIYSSTWNISVLKIIIDRRTCILLNDVNSKTSKLNRNSKTNYK